MLNYSETAFKELRIRQQVSCSKFGLFNKDDIVEDILIVKSFIIYNNDNLIIDNGYVSTQLF